MFGYLYTGSYVLFSAYSFIFTVLVSEGHSKIITLFFSSLIGTLFFHLLNASHLQELYHKMWIHRSVVIGLNVSSGFGWLTAILALDYLDPATMLCINAGSIPIFNFFLVTKPKEYRKNYPLLLAIVAVLLSMGLIIKENYRFLATATSAVALGLGILFSVIDGLASAFNGIFSERLTRVGIRAKEVLVFRFVLLTFLTGILSLIRGDFALLTWEKIGSFIVGACLMMIIPLLLYQKGIEKLGCLAVAMLMPFIPICAYFMQIATGRYSFDFYICIAIILCSMTLLIMNFMTYTSHHTDEKPKRKYIDG